MKELKPERLCWNTYSVEIMCLETQYSFLWLLNKQLEYKRLLRYTESILKKYKAILKINIVKIIYIQVITLLSSRFMKHDSK